MDTENLDAHLRAAMVHLSTSDNQYRGVVAAGIISGDRVVYAISEKYPPKTAIHAERNALRAYRSRYGELPGEGSVLVATLSPCSAPSKNRRDAPCIDLLTGTDGEFSGLRVARVHVGLMDPTQDITAHLENGFSMTVTVDTELMEASRRLFSYFSPEKYGTAKDDFLRWALEDLDT
jgi:pyrimidine deaminase RibD-like protein